MKRRTGSWRRLHPAARAAIVLVVIVVVVNVVLSLLDSSTRGSDDTAPRSSSLSTGREGLAAYAELLRRNGHDTEAQRGNVTADALSSADTLVVLDPVGFDRDQERAVRRFVERGGRLLAGGAGDTTLLLSALLTDPPVWSPTGIRDAEPVGGAPEVAGLRSVRTAGEGSWSEPGATTPVLGDGSRALATVATLGRGRVVALADASPLQNRLLGTADNAGFGLAAAGDGRAVVFAEGAHGYGHASGLGAIPGRWQAALVGLTVAALLGVVAAGRRLGPPEEERTGAATATARVRRRRRRLARPHEPACRRARAAPGGSACTVGAPRRAAADGVRAGAEGGGDPVRMDGGRDQRTVHAGAHRR